MILLVREMEFLFTTFFIHLKVFYFNLATTSDMIQVISNNLSTLKMNSDVQSLLSTNPLFLENLSDAAKTIKGSTEIVQKALHFIKSTEKTRIKKAKGYEFVSVLSYSGQSNVVVLKAISIKNEAYCAKVGPKKIILDEFNVGEIVKGECIMPVIDFIELNDGRAIMITPLYSIGSVANYCSKLVDVSGFVDEQVAVCFLLCGLSAIYKFSEKSLCHCDIKLENFVMLGLTKFVLIDFGSVCKFGDIMKSSTPLYSFAYSDTYTRYDINGLTISVGFLLTRKADQFRNRDHLLKSVENLGYKIVLEMLNRMMIDEDLNLDEFGRMWRNVYEYAVETIEVVKDCSFLKPAC